MNAALRVQNQLLLPTYSTTPAAAATHDTHDVRGQLKLLASALLPLSLFVRRAHFIRASGL